jgi:hypothetical protein
MAGGFRWLELLWPWRGGRSAEVEILDETAVRRRTTVEHYAFPEWAARTGLAGAAGGMQEAHARGLRLLWENLTLAQREQYAVCGYFDVIGGQTGRRYRISRGTQMNVERLDRRGRAVHGLCFAPAGGLVAGDVMLGQKLALELFEADVLKVANKFSAG